MNEITVYINGTEVKTTTDKTILQVVKENNLDEIPTLCHDDRIEHFTSCYLCVVEVEGINKFVPSCSTYCNDGMKVTTKNEAIFDTRKTALELLFSNHYADCVGPCKHNCPADVDAQAYIALISMGKYEEALRVIKENNPLPLSIGRVCVRDCENACRRHHVDDAVAVNYLKRFVADIDMKDSWVPEVKERNGKKIAVIGGGPAGLTAAYYLTLEGYQVKIFEKLPALGGMLRYGIPEYRLPKQVLDTEIQWILDLGIDVETGVELGVDFSVEELKAQGYDSVFVGVGAHKASKMRLDGEDKTEGVFRGIDFLRELILSYTPKLEGTVAIVGGGNTAIDAARTALRCGADSVKLIYRRSIKEMPAHHEEIEAAQEEGVEMLFLTNPTSILSKDGKLKGVECIKMELKDAGDGSRPRPVPIEGSEYVVDCNYLVSAIGQGVDTTFIEKDKEMELESWGTIIVNEDTLETSIPGVFAGGDAVTGPLTAVASIGQGKQAALSIMNYLDPLNDAGRKSNFVSMRHNLSQLTDREFEDQSKIKRSKMNELDVNERIKTFDEVELGLCDSEVGDETTRCLECGCSEYYDCTLIKHGQTHGVDIKNFVGETKKYKVDTRHPFITMDANKCINCGRCVRTCAEVLKVSALGFVHRGFKSVVAPAMEKALADTNCISCGNCIDTCPTGALSEKFPFKTLGTMPKYNHEAICNFCSIGCKVNFKKVDNDIFYVSNSTEEIMQTHNNGYLCIKGRFGHRYLTEGELVKEPVIRHNGIMEEKSYEDSLKYAASKVKNIIEQYGKDSVAVFASPKLSNEDLYSIQKFARKTLGTNNITSFSNMIYNENAQELNDAYGMTVSTVSMDDINNADTIVVINSNLSEENLVMELKLKAAQKKGAKVVLINSSEIKLAKFADLWVDSKKGTNTALLNGITNELIRNNKIDSNFIDQKTEGYEDLKEMVSYFAENDVPLLTEISAEKYQNLYKELSNSDSNIIFIYNIDSRSDKSVNDLKGIGNFLTVTGRINKPNNGVLILREATNSTGLLDMGVTPNYLPGYVRFKDKLEVNRISEKWNVDLEDTFKPVDVSEKLQNGDIKAVLIFGEDPLAETVNRKYFNAVKFTFAADAFNTVTTDEADVRIPLTTFIEREGSYTRCDNTVQKSHQVTNGRNVKTPWKVAVDLSKYFDNKLEFESIKNIDAEIKVVNRYYSENDNGDSWTKKLFTNGYISPESKVKFSIYDIDFETVAPIKPNIDFAEKYYEKNVKQLLT
jgi:formate dehydrogenase major subunit